MKIIIRTALILALSASPASAYVYFTPESLVAEYFPGGETVETVMFTPDVEAMRATLGYRLAKRQYEIQIARKDDIVTGYLVIDEQLGLHEPITFGVLLDTEALVRRIEVMVYREAYGDGVRAATFREQFNGRDATSPMRAGKDIEVVSGSTVSTRSLCTGVRRASALVAAYIAEGP